MAGTVVPFTFITGKTDTSDFRALTRPLRTFTPREEWVYEQLAIDWAELNGLEQKSGLCPSLPWHVHRTPRQGV